MLPLWKRAERRGGLIDRFLGTGNRPLDNLAPQNGNGHVDSLAELDQRRILSPDVINAGIMTLQSKRLMIMVPSMARSDKNGEANNIIPQPQLTI